MAHAQHISLNILGRGGMERSPTTHLRWWMNVIERATWTREAFGAEDLFAVERAIGTKELDVSLAWHFAALNVVGHALIFRCEREWLEIAATILFKLEAFEQCTEIAFAKALRASTTDDFNKQRGPILQRHGEQLK